MEQTLSKRDNRSLKIFITSSSSMMNFHSNKKRGAFQICTSYQSYTLPDRCLECFNTRSIVIHARSNNEQENQLLRGKIKTIHFNSIDIQNKPLMSEHIHL